MKLYLGLSKEIARFMDFSLLKEGLDVATGWCRMTETAEIENGTGRRGRGGSKRECGVWGGSNSHTMETEKLSEVWTTELSETRWRCDS